MTTFSVPQDALQGALSWVVKAVGGRSTLPVLFHAHFSVAAGKCVITASDLAHWHQETIGVEGDDCALTADAKRLLALVQSFPAKAAVTFNQEDGNKWRVSCQGIKTLFHSLPPDEFPQVRPEEETVISRFTYPTELCIHGLASVMSFASKTENRPNICTTFIETKGDRLRFVSTDTHRLGRCSFPTPVSVDGEPVGAMLPSRGANTLHGLLTAHKDEASVQIAITKQGMLVATLGGVTLRCRLVEGLYPTYERVIPTDHNRSMVAQVEALANALKRAGLIALDDSNRVQFDMGDPDCQGHLLVSAKAPIGEHQETVDLARTGESLTTAFNYLFALDALRVFQGVFKSEDVRFEFTAGDRPAVLRPTGESADHYLCVLMPMSIPVSVSAEEGR